MYQEKHATVALNAYVSSVIFSVPEETKIKQTWKTTINNYKDAVTITQQPNEYSDDIIVLVCCQ